MAGYYMGVPSPATIIAVLSALLALNISAVVLRFVARKKLKQPFLSDDWLTIPSLVRMHPDVLNQIRLTKTDLVIRHGSQHFLRYVKSHS